MSDSSEIVPHPAIVQWLRQIPTTPVALRKAFLLLTRTHYSSASNYGPLAEKLKDFIWDPSPKPKLWIDLDYNYNPKDMDHRPAIFVGLDDFGYDQVVIDGRVSSTPDGAGEEYHNRGSTRVIIRHVGKTPDEALELGNLSAQYFRALRKVMKTQIGLTRYVVSRLSGARVFDKEAVQADKHLNADLIIELAFNTNWMIFTESHRLKNWTFDQLLAHTGPSGVDWSKPISPQ